MLFRDRRHAGRLLADMFGRAARALRDPVVLALPRGGLPVAQELAGALRARLDVLVVRKIVVPWFPEYALGAAAEGGALWLSSGAMRTAGLRGADVAAFAEEAEREVARQVRRYRGGRRLELAGRTALLVDDGVASGATARAAARSARLAGAAEVVLAAPVIAPVTAPELHGEFDRVVAVEIPAGFFGIAQWYEHFARVTDEEVLRILAEARSALLGASAGTGARPEPRA